MLFVLGTPPNIKVCDPWQGFLHVLYQLWLVGVATRHLEILIRRHKTWLTWWWPCDMESKEGIPLVLL